MFASEQSTHPALRTSAASSRASCVGAPNVSDHTLDLRRRSMPVGPSTLASPYSLQAAKSGMRPGVKTWGSEDRPYESATWDGLRRDPSLWLENGDCSVFLYRRGHSRRGAAFQIPLSSLADAQCLPLLSAIHTPSSARDALASLSPTDARSSRRAELYLPAPDMSTREEAFQWHLTTRNFFAWLCEKPLVGRHLGRALSDLLQRMREWRDQRVNSVEDMLIYCDQMRYSSVENSPDRALAMLHFAETHRLRNVWIDAFAHCVGMDERLSPSSEFSLISRKTKALITRAFLEMDLHLERASQSLGNFLDDELSSAYLGLGAGARHHLDNFRSFLQTYHVAKYGYWPPSRSSAFPKELYLSMYVDFSNLYHLLADKESSEPWRSNNGGGICVQQAVEAFNSRQKYEPLPYSLPLLPQACLADGRSKSQLSLRAIVNSAKESSSRHFRAERARSSLRGATNKLDQNLSDSEIVLRYIAFEDDQATKPDGDVSLADARRIRWLLIYAALQTLVSIMSAPPEVRNTQDSPHALCVLTEGIPPWEFESCSTLASPQQTPLSAVFPPDVQKTFHDGSSTPPISVEPDCEAADFLNPAREKSQDVHSRREPTSPKRPASRGSFLRRASTLGRWNAPQPPVSAPPPPAVEFVSGRTLAELAYGRQPEAAAPTSLAPKDFDFGFTSNRSGESSTAPKVSLDPLQEPTSPTSGEALLLLPDEPKETLAYASSESSSVPSLTFSLASREVQDSEPLELEHALLVNSHAGTKAIVDDAGDYYGLEVPRGFVKIRGPGVTKTIHSGNLPRSVTKGYDYFERVISESSSGTESPASTPGAVDRAAAIALDGNVSEEAVEMYRAARS